MKIAKLIPILSLCLAGSQVFAASLKELRKAEKISLTLTGKPLADDLREKFMKDELSLAALTEILSKSADFKDRYAQYWTQVFGFQGPLDAHELKPQSTGRTLYQMNNGQFTGLDPNRKDILDEKALSRTATALESLTVPALVIDMCADAPLIRYSPIGTPSRAQLDKAVNEGIGFDGLPILANTKPYWERIRNFYYAAIPICTEDLPKVKPWWDPTEVTIEGRYAGVKEYKVSNFVLAKCGAKLERCSLGGGRRSPDRLANLVNQDLTLEPGYLISYIVAEDRPFSEVLTSSSTIMTGTMGEFMSHLGKDMWGNFPLGGYKDAAHPIFTNPQVFDRKLYRIERNNIHAGVLTTPAYQMLTNGARAKANKAYETFLCRKFVVPEGGKPDPNDANPDLTKRAYCSFCHKSLEPMAAFWNRWPEVGNVNYLYNASSTIDDSGRYDGKTGKGALAFGKILTESENFAECSVTRAFEFVYGRKMTKIEKENQLEDMIDKFNESGQKLRSTIKSLLLAPEFFNSKGE